MEKPKSLSAEEVDSPKLTEKKGLEKGTAVEHLRDLRDVFTPFIQLYVKNVTGNPEIEKDILPRARWAIEGKGGGYKPHIAPNYERLIDLLGDHPDTALLCLTESPEKGYQRYCRQYKMPDSDQSHKVFGFYKSGVVSAVKKAGFTDYIASLTEVHPKITISHTPFFAQLIEYVSINASHLTDEALLHDRSTEWFKELGLKKSEKMLWGHTSTEEESFPRMLVIPTGEYGERFAKKIYATVQAMLRATDPLEEESKKIVEAHKEILAKTARGEQDMRQLKDMSAAAIKTLQEGIVTLGQSLALLTAEKIPGYADDPDRLLRDLIDQELPNKLAFSAPPAFIGPLSLIGKYVHRLVVVGPDSKLMLNPEILQITQEAKDFIIQGGLTSEAANQDYLPAVGRGCPVSYKGRNIETSGINILSMLFKDIYNKL